MSSFFATSKCSTVDVELRMWWPRFMTSTCILRLLHHIKARVVGWCLVWQLKGKNGRYRSSVKQVTSAWIIDIDFVFLRAAVSTSCSRSCCVVGTVGKSVEGGTWNKKCRRSNPGDKYCSLNLLVRTMPSPKSKHALAALAGAACLSWRVCS